MYAAGGNFCSLVCTECQVVAIGPRSPRPPRKTPRRPALYASATDLGLR
uniref:Uncharacterized protein n=1 Tax=Arundo donax TaxID=35708 RepID=A0A0A9CFL2_ARUDO